MKVYTCTIARQENKYIREFVEHYRRMGFTKMFIYDNGFDDEESPESQIKEYIDEGFVELIEFRDKRNAHCDAYNDFIVKHVDECDWALFVDVDEFFFLKGVDGIDTLNGFLSMNIFNDFDEIVVNWETYGDDGHILETEGNVVDRFKQFKECGYNGLGKVFMRGRTKYYFKGGDWHMNPMLRACNECGEKLEIDFNLHKNKYACINHYMTKSTEEFIEKAERGYPDNPMFTNDQHKQKKEFIKEMFMRKYLKINEMTDEKNEYIKQRLGWFFDMEKLRKVLEKQ